MKLSVGDRIPRPWRVMPTLSVALAVVIIGCGGGGGGGSQGGTVIGGGSNGSGPITGDPVTTGGSTTGGTVGGTTGSTDPTTGGTTSTTGATTGGTTTGGSTTDGTTGTDGSTTTTTGGTSADTTGSSTTGSTTGTTTGSSTTGGSTTGTTGTSTTTGTTGTSTTGTSGTTGTTTGTSTTGTTGSSSTTGTTGTTGSTTTTGTTGGTGGPTGALRPNAIYFGHYWGDGSVVTSILPDGTGRQDTSGGASNVLCAFPDPDTAGKTIYAALVASSYGVYRGTSFNVSASQVLAAPTYDSVQTLQPAPNGAVLVVATVGMTSNAYLLAGGTSQLIDQADAASISADGSKVVYTKTVSDISHLYVWDRASGSVQAIAPSFNAVLPSFSRDSAWVLFSSDNGNTSDTPWDLYQVPTAGGTIERLTNTPAVNELGACYDPTRTMISYFGQALTTSLSGIYVRSNAGAQRIATDTDVNFATYWTSADGRSFGHLKGGRFQKIQVRRSKRR